MLGMDATIIVRTAPGGALGTGASFVPRTPVIRAFVALVVAVRFVACMPHVRWLACAGGAGSSDPQAIR